MFLNIPQIMHTKVEDHCINKIRVHKDILRVKKIRISKKISEEKNESKMPKRWPTTKLNQHARKDIKKNEERLCEKIEGQ
jgi:hypothetical protein